MSEKTIAFYIKLLLAILAAIHELLDCEEVTPTPEGIAVTKQPK